MPVTPQSPDPDRQRIAPLHRVEPPAKGADPIDLPDEPDDELAKKPKSRRRPFYVISRIGLLGEIAALVALLLCRKTIIPPRFQFDPVWPAAVGLALGLLGLIGSVLGSRAKKGVPLLAILFALTAIGITAYRDDVRDVPTARTWATAKVQIAQYWYQNTIGRYLPKSVPVAPAPQPSAPPMDSTASTPNGVPAAPSTPTPPAAGSASPSDSIGGNSIFNMKNPSSAPPEGPAGSGGDSIGSPSVPSTENPTPQFKKGPSAQVIAAQNAYQDALAACKSTEDEFRTSYANSNSADYASAKSAVDAAQQQVDTAKQNGDGVMDAVKQRLAAQTQLNAIVGAAMQKDPAVVAARQKLATAEAAWNAAGRVK